MSPLKEPGFFAPELIEHAPRPHAQRAADGAELRAWLDGPMPGKRDHGTVLEWESYLMLFRHVQDESAIGEATVAYLASRQAAQRIHARIPEARIVMLLRDPADRLFSQYAAFRATRSTSLPFAAWLEAQARQEAAGSTPFGHIRTGRYGEHLERFLRFFPRERIFVGLYDDFAQAPASVLRELFAFLNVNPEAAIDTRQRHNTTLLPRYPLLQRVLPASFRRRLASLLPARTAAVARRWYHAAPPLRATPADRSLAVEAYAPDIQLLQRLLARDLSPWLDVSAGRLPREPDGGRLQAGGVEAVP